MGNVRQYQYQDIYESDIKVAGNYKHGDAPLGKKTSLYRSWQNLKSRCLYKGAKGYDTCGGLGLTFKRAWLEFVVFREWCLENGYTEGACLCRKNKNVGYFPGNIEFVTKPRGGHRKNGLRRGFSQEEIKAIRESKQNYAACSRVYGVSLSTIRNIRKFKSYREETKDNDNV